MNYEQAISRLRASQQLGSRLGLGRMKALMEALGNPQDRLKIIHVGGTNGKGSVCTYLTQILKENGYSTGTFLSPYLESPLDSILMSGQEISREDFIAAAEIVFEAADTLFAASDTAVENTGDQATEFELLTAIAFVAFESANVDFVILEVGLGGRQDATNIIKAPLMSVITSISIDHKGILGDTVEKIASEKVGIIKAGCPVVSNVKDEKAQAVIKEKAAEMAGPFYDATVFKAYDVEKDIRGYSFTIDERAADAIVGKAADAAPEKVVNDATEETAGDALDNALRIRLGMAGDHQISNGICAIFVVNLLVKMGIIKVTADRLQKAMAKSRQKGRLEVISENPLILADGAHNVDGIKALRKTVEEHFAHKKILLVLGMIKGKEADLIVGELCSLEAHLVTTEPENFMRFKAKKLCKLIEEAGCRCESLGPMGKAMEYLDQVKDEYDVIIITGSLYLAGKAGRYFSND